MVLIHYLFFFIFQLWISQTSDISKFGLNLRLTDIENRLCKVLTRAAVAQDYIADHRSSSVVVQVVIMVVQTIDTFPCNFDYKWSSSF